MKVTHAIAVAIIYPLVNMASSNSVAYQAALIADKLDEAEAELARACEQVCSNANRVAKGEFGRAELLGKSAAACAELAGKIQAYKAGLEALLTADGTVKRYKAALVGESA